MEREMSRLSWMPLLCCALMLGSCGNGRPASDINRPMAQARLETAASYDALRPAIWKFSRDNNFAVQEQQTGAQGMLDFSVELFRDDIRVSISRLRGESVMLSASPLCASERGRRLGLQAGADAAVNKLKEALSHR